MSIIRNETPQTTDAASQARKTDTTARAPRERPDAESAQRFQQLMQQREASRHGAGDAGPGLAERAADEVMAARERLVAPVTGREGSGRDGFAGSDALPPAEFAAMWQAQQMAQQGPATPAAMPAPPVNSGAFAELLERHVRQLAVNDARSASGDGQVLLRLADSTLPGTDLLLSRTADGWLLRADVRSRDSFDAIEEAGARLSERFAARGLGTLSIESRLHA